MCKCTDSQEDTAAYLLVLSLSQFHRLIRKEKERNIIVTLLLFPISYLREKSDLYYVQYLFTSFLTISDCVLI